MAQAVVEGAKQVPGAEVSLYQVAELIPDDVLQKHGPKAAGAGRDRGATGRRARHHLWHSNALRQHGRAGRNFLDPMGPLWAKGIADRKDRSVFASTRTQHGGQEITLTSFHTTLLHHGMVIVGVPYSESGLAHMGDITGGTPYGATTLALTATE